MNGASLCKWIQEQGVTGARNCVAIPRPCHPLFLNSTNVQNQGKLARKFALVLHICAV